MQEYRADSEVVILDFETTGLSTHCDRIIEVGAAIVEGDVIKSTFTSLCNPGIYIPSFITGLTGITNQMLEDQPNPEEVMSKFNDYIGDRPILAHNASFDIRFLNAEMGKIGNTVENPNLCTMLLARRLILDSHDHKLGTMKEYINFESEDDHTDHRALDDVKVTVSLWVHLRALVEKMVGHNQLEFKDYQQLSRVSKYKVKDKLALLSERALQEC